MKARTIRKHLSLILTGTLLLSLVPLAGQRGQTAKAAENGIQNPRIAEDGTVTWDKVQFGTYPQTLKEYQKEPIKWRILDIDEEGNAFLLADQALDCKPYNETYESVTWETCTLRSWLNNDFLNEAFTEEEREEIISTTVVNDDNPEYGTDSGNDTTDKIYLLSIAEASNEDYGFDSTFTYYNTSETRCAKATDYAVNFGCKTSSFFVYARNCYWWLRSPGGIDGEVVGDDGRRYNGEINVDDDYMAVRPVLHVPLSSAGVKDAGTMASDGTVAEGDGIYDKPFAELGESISVTTWDCVYFGSYRKTAVFEEEPIAWQVLSVDRDDVFLLADQALDCKPYNDTYESVTWETSTLRTWLNEAFLHTAFTVDEQAAIRSTTVVNDDNPDYGTGGGNNTTDRIFLLSISEASDADYGFSNIFNKDLKRATFATDYEVNNDQFSDRFSRQSRNCCWWLRSPGYNTYTAAYVDNIGGGDDYGEYVYFGYSVRPAMHVSLSSANLTYAGTVSAGGGTPVSEDPENTTASGGTESGSGTSTQGTSSDTLSTGTGIAGASNSSATSAGDTSSAGTTASTTNSTSSDHANTDNTANSNLSTDSAEPTSGSEAAAPKKGTTLTSTKTKAKYKVTKAGKSGGTVAYTGTTNKKATALTIPAAVTIDGITYKVTSIEASAFAKNTKLQSVTIGSNVKTIGTNAFSGCTALKRVTIGKSVTVIGKKAFYGCKSLKTLTITSTKLKSVGVNAFKGISAKAKIKVPAKKLAAYKKLLKGKGQGKKVTITK